MDYGYLQHGKAGEPMYTERVTVKPDVWPHVGQWLAHYEGRWRRVHQQVKCLYIVHGGRQINIVIEGV